MVVQGLKGKWEEHLQAAIGYLLHQSGKTLGGYGIHNIWVRFHFLF